MQKGVKHDPNDYCPISLLSYFDMIFENIFCRMLISFLERMSSCIVISMFFVNYNQLVWHSLKLLIISNTCLMKKNLISIFIDFKKALDRVDHEILLHKLEYYGIRVIANILFRSYLTNRRQYTMINGIKSDLRTIMCGVPARVRLRSIVFLLYINYLHEGIGCNAARLCADATALITSSHNFNIVQDQDKELFVKLYHWCIAHKLSINSVKTSLVLFHLKNKPVPRGFTGLQTQAMKIDKVQSVQYLRMLIDEKLYWYEHVNQTCASLIKYFGMFNQIKNVVSVKIARQCYFAFVYSRIQYGIDIYGNCARETLSKLQVMQNT